MKPIDLTENNKIITLAQVVQPVGCGGTCGGKCGSHARPSLLVRLLQWLGKSFA